MFAFDESAQTYRRLLPKIYTNVHDYAQPIACPIEDLIEMYRVQAQKQEAATAHAVKTVPRAQRVIVGFCCGAQ